MKDDKLVKEIKKGNEKALESLIDKYGWIVKTVVSKHLFYFENLQEECINDIFLGVWNNIEKYNPEKASLKNWIASISKYKAIDYLRKYYKELNEQNIDDITNITSEEDDYKEIIENGVDEELEELIAPLKERDKVLFRKLFYEEKTVEEISLEDNISPSNIYNRVSRGKKKIKKKLEAKEAK